MTTGRGGAGRRRTGSEADGRPAPDGPRGKSDVMQAALHAEAYMSSPDEAHLLRLADDADPPTSVTQGIGGTDDEHDYDDVVQQSFPASDPPPPRG